MKAIVERLVRALAASALGLAGAALALAAVAGFALRAAPGDWTATVGDGRIAMAASMPTLLRWATHPLARRLVDGRVVATSHGRWLLTVRGDGAIQARCAPCRWRTDALGAAPVEVAEAMLTLRALGADRFEGTLRLGAGTGAGFGAGSAPATAVESSKGAAPGTGESPDPAAGAGTGAGTGAQTAAGTSPAGLESGGAVDAGAERRGGRAALVLAWHGVLRRDGIALQARLAPTALATLLEVLAVPEAASARVEGRFAFAADARIDGAGLRIERLVPTLEGVAVEGLGTEALRDADVGARCRPQPAAGRVEGWLPHAVVAAEDQRFLEHPGYEPDAWIATWRRNAQAAPGGAPAPLHGASTITQQLAKLLYTGDERSALRKLREWLYAVEMERTLGKGRILQLYLALAPWGDGVCGAEAAARHHLGKPASQLRPREAAFLAGLLVNPDAQVRRWAADDAQARERAAFVLRGMRRLPRERREAELEALADWQPPVGRPLLARPAP